VIPPGGLITEPATTTTTQGKTELFSPGALLF